MGSMSNDPTTTGLNEAAVARRLNVVYQRVAQLRNEGKLTATKSCLGWIYHADSVERLRLARDRRRALRALRQQRG
jgi:hypothetical protein